MLGKKSSYRVAIAHRLQLDCLIAFAPASLIGPDRRSISGSFYRAIRSSIIKIFEINSSIWSQRRLAERWKARVPTQQHTATKLIVYWSRRLVIGQTGTRSKIKAHDKNKLPRMQY